MFLTIFDVPHNSGEIGVAPIEERTMRALTVASLVFGLAFSAASIATAAEVKKATFLKQAPKALGSGIEYRNLL